MGSVLELKVVMVGEVGVGKTSIANRFIEDKFSDKMRQTIGATYMYRDMKVPRDDEGEVQVKFSLWDTAGQEMYHSLVPVYFRQAAAVVLVYDILNTKGLQAARSWVDQVVEHAPPGVIMALAGNKLDLEDERKVSRADADELAHDIQAAFHTEISAKTGEGVTDLFLDIGKRFLRTSQAKAILEKPSVSLPSSAPREKKCAC
eukprot:Sspe_Gene.105192::Locus_82246_Transcript_1_1_Confidence_1.000_Length_841::g.105192::m.105192/K07891/RAB22; Ras-related protein Rab-22